MCYFIVCFSTNVIVEHIIRSLYIHIYNCVTVSNINVQSHRRYVKFALGDEDFQSHLLPAPQSKDRIIHSLICVLLIT